MGDLVKARGGGGGGGSYPYGDQRGPYVMNCNSSRLWDEMTADERKCLEERKYWCFLLSSIVTFCLSMLVVVSWRIAVHLCCRGGGKRSKTVDDLVEEEPVQNGKLAIKSGAESEGGAPPGKEDEIQIGWMTEAKDWAGELISGQTTTGRILVGTTGHYFLMDVGKGKRQFALESEF